jgi:hypothetical protein
MAYNYNMHNERISEEAHGDNLAFLTQDKEALSELGFESLLTDSFFMNFPVDGTCDFAQFAGKLKNLYLIKTRILFDLCLFYRINNQSC